MSELAVRAVETTPGLEQRTDRLDLRLEQPVDRPTTGSLVDEPLIASASRGDAARPWPGPREVEQPARATT